MMKKYFLTLIALLLPLLASAEYDAKIDGIFYLLNNESKTALVTYDGSEEYVGDVVIPPSVEYNGVTYQVTTIMPSTFFFCSKLTSVSLPEGLTSIRENAFHRCENLTSIILPKTLKIIGDDAFAYCTGLTSPLFIPNKVTSIGIRAFKGCQKISSITFGSSVKTIGEEAFYDCKGITSVAFLKSTPPTFGNFVFGNISTRSCKVWVPNGCTSAFSNVSGLSYFGGFEEIPQYCVNIDGFNYYAYEKLKELMVKSGPKRGDIVIPSKVVYDGEIYRVTSIDDYAFQGCTGITSVVCPGSVNRIGRMAFNGCTNLADISVFSYLADMGEDVLAGTAWYNNQPDGMVYIENIAYGYKGEMSANTCIAIKNGTLGIAGNAFGDCKNLSCVTTPNSLKIIGPSAFDYCSRLSSITIGSGVTSIGEHAFRGCTNLSSIGSLNSTPPSLLIYAFDDVVLKNSVVWVPKSSLENYSNSNTWSGFSTIEPIPQNCKNVYGFNFGTESESSWVVKSGPRWGNVVIPSQATYEGKTYPVKEIESGAFENSTGMKSLTILYGVASIGLYTFRGCTNLASISIPKSLTYMGTEAFAGSAWYDNQPDGMVYLGSVAYAYKGEMPANTSIVIKKGTRVIAGSAFYNQSGLTSVTFPVTMSSIGDFAFENCSSLSSITFDFFGYGQIGLAAFSGCTSLTSVEIDFVKSISPWAFSGCTSLETVVIGNAVSDIGYQAFKDCTSLKFISIGAIVSNIYDEAFSGCTSLTTIMSRNILPPTKSNFVQYVESPPLFADVDKQNCVLWVPESYGYNYASADEWKDFENIVEYKKFDLNQDGEEDRNDLIPLVQYIMGKNPKGFPSSLFDFNGNGKVNAADIVLLNRAVM